MTEAVTLLCPNGVAVTAHMRRRVTRTEVALAELDPLGFADYVARRLDEAGLTLARMRVSGHGTGMRSYWPELVRQVFHDEAPPVSASIPAPAANAISQMDETFRWLALLPSDPSRLRTVVLKRLIVSAITEKHRYSWRRLGDLLGCDHKTAKRWHADAIAHLSVKIAFMNK